MSKLLSPVLRSGPGRHLNGRFMVRSGTLSTLDVQLYRRWLCPHLVHADIVSKGALDHRGVVIDIQDGHLQDVVLPPWRGATVRCHNLQGGG